MGPPDTDAPLPAPTRDHRLAGRTAQRRLGAFYTAAAPTRTMAEWALRGPRDRVLEPSFGGGAFLSAVHAVREARGLDGVELFGAELVEETFAAGVASGLVEGIRAFHGDFLAVDPFPVDAVLGNPPYVRLRHLPDEQQRRAMEVATAALGRPMEASGSVWMPFVLHALRFLRTGGRLALVLPFDLTYVRYARPLWAALGEAFASLRLVRVHERLFPDLLQDVVVLFAEGFGGRTDHVDFVALDRAAGFADAASRPGVSVCIADVSVGDRAFMRALLDPALLELLTTRVFPATVPVRDRCAVHIGYVTGHKGYFHPTSDEVRAYSLPSASLRAAATTSRQLTGLGLRTSALTEPERLFLPHAAPLTEGERRYIGRGVTEGVAHRYKCRIREPWYVVPGVHVPDLVLSVFSERPVLLLNDARLVVTNSLLCGFVREGTAPAFVAAWYTSLTLLLCELEVHSLGGGVLVLVPGEVGSVRIAPDVPVPAGHLDELHRRLAAGDPDGAYALGDDLVLRGRLGLGDEDLALLRTGAATLRRWRTSSRAGAGE